MVNVPVSVKGALAAALLLAAAAALAELLLSEADVFAASFCRFFTVWIDWTSTTTSAAAIRWPARTCRI
jgi:hypothetical protein